MSVETTAKNLETDRFSLSGIKLRFLDAAIEREFRDWRVLEGIPMTRLGMQVSIINWLAALGCLFIVDAAYRNAFAVWILGVQLPLIIGTLLLTYRSTGRRWIASLTAATNAMAGLTCVAGSFWGLDRPEISTSAVVMVSQFAFTIFPLRVPAALGAVLSFVAFHELVLLAGYQMGEVSGVSALFYSLGPVLALLSGGLACVIIERGSRERFRQGKIIEMQRRTIERERARADVAERSRELSEALTRLTEAGRSSTQLVPGDVIESKFRVVKALGRGGMGEVHEVEQLTDGKHLALKVLTGKIDREALMRFAREARIGASIDHLNVVEVVEVGVAPAGMYLVMELVNGPSLLAMRERYGDVAWAVPMLAQIAEALASMHGRGIVHRDLKPGNILLEGGTTPKVTDFGISSLSDAPAPEQSIDARGATVFTSAGDLGLTRTGAMFGTPRYMAPELTAGSSSARAPSDLWSFGIIAYEVLTGSNPFAEAPLLARLAGRTVVPPRPLDAKLSPAMAEIIERCLAIEPEQRPTALAVRDVLTTKT